MKPKIGDCTEYPGFMSRTGRVETPCVKGGTHPRFACRNRKHGDRSEIVQLHAHTFIKRFLMHVLPSGFVRIRHYGLLANHCKAYTLPLCRQALGQDAPSPHPEPKNVA